FCQAAGYDVQIGRAGIKYVVHGRKNVPSWSIRENLVGVSDLKVVGRQPAPTRVNFFLGRHSSSWASNLPAYTSVSLGQPVKGIHLSLRLSEGVAEKIIRLDSGKEIEQLRFSLRGIESLDVDKRGRLLLKKGSESVHFSAPVAFQEVGGKRVAVEVAYHLTGKKEYGFTLGDFDASLPVTVDPGLVASTLFRWRWNL
ncbi:hypothetical protein, partial [Thiolapillus sp.]|uniref:DUF7948 domain-containing protein n=1 Tax=Thiolapillus sp. TaxID=2017437 RepID=UPI003AF510C0